MDAWSKCGTLIAKETLKFWDNEDLLEIIEDNDTALDSHEKVQEFAAQFIYGKVYLVRVGLKFLMIKNDIKDSNRKKISDAFVDTVIEEFELHQFDFGEYKLNLESLKQTFISFEKYVSIDREGTLDSNKIVLIDEVYAKRNNDFEWSWFAYDKCVHCIRMGCKIHRKVCVGLVKRMEKDLLDLIYKIDELLKHTKDSMFVEDLKSNW